MKKLHSFIIKIYVGPFLLTFLIAQFLLLMQFLWKYIDDLVGKGFEVTVILELLLYASATLVPLSLPLAILLSSLLTFGNLGEHNELMALKSAGISLWRILFPIQMVVIFIGIGAFFFMNNVLPYTNLKMGALLYSVRHQSPEVSIVPGVFNNAIDGYSIKVDHKDVKTGLLYDITIYDHRDDEGNLVVTKADSATMKMTADKKNMIFTLYSGQTYQEVKEKNHRREERQYPHRINKFSMQRLLIDMSGMQFQRTDEDLFKNNYQMLNMDQLDYAIDSLEKGYKERKDDFVNSMYSTHYFKKILREDKDSMFMHTNQLPDSSYSCDSLWASMDYQKKMLAFENAKNFARGAQSFVASQDSEYKFKKERINKHKNEWHKKMAIGVSCILLFFLGAPLGAIIRKGGMGLPVVGSVVLFVIYYVISMSAEKSAKAGTIDSWFGMWFSSLVILPLGIFLTYKAVNDSQLLNKDSWGITWKKALKKIGGFFKRKGNDDTTEQVEYSDTLS